MEPTAGSLDVFLSAITPKVRQRDARSMVELMRRITAEEPQLWGSIIGFGSYHYRYASGREGDAPAAGFAARRQATTIYLPEGVEAHAEALDRLGPHSTGVGCLYIPRLDQVDLAVLEEIIAGSYRKVTAW
ncbi:DUF1801 domain-containing protein [Nesterenkonia sp. E16_7]|uniref:DUF1801 domain-containing protein n=1 Tax=unclassified Nesterenkonia TaxID=2629769 RepID=UPI001A914749|nr:MULTISPECIES: DUF1801 domain-containing protein [unclassified Nesterenkonia]MBO0596112.1 DUF1801 domain-containing protein [Nesterenkonia sp. E16_10]MBO0599285.1 DUF1801 domain-containing protein [Nesterenkonia sp. E16_7]